MVASSTSDALAVKFMDANSPDVARWQEWILANIHKAEEEHTPFATAETPASPLVTPPAVLSSLAMVNESLMGASTSILEAVLKAPGQPKEVTAFFRITFFGWRYKIPKWSGIYLFTGKRSIRQLPN